MPDERTVSTVVAKVGVPLGLGARHGPGITLHTARSAHAAVHDARGRQFRIGEAARLVCGRATQGLDIEPAHLGVADLSVCQTILRVTGRVGCLAEQLALGRWQCRRLALHRRQGLRGVKQPGQDFRIELGRRTSCDTVEQLGITLRHHHRLAPAIGTALKVRMAHWRGIVGLGQRLCGAGDVEMGAQAPVPHFFWMVHCP